MRNYRFGRNNIRVLLCCMVAGWILWYFFGPARIVPIEGSLNVIPPDEHDQSWSVEEQFIVVRAPGDLYELRELFEAYDKRHPIDQELVQQKIEKLRRNKSIPECSIRYARVFYRESADTSLDWNGEREPNMDGREAFHSQDDIGGIYWSDGDTIKEYVCIKQLEDEGYRRIDFYPDGRAKFSEYRPKSGIDIEHSLENWY